MPQKRAKAKRAPGGSGKKIPEWKVSMTAAEKRKRMAAIKRYMDKLPKKKTSKKKKK